MYVDSSNFFKSSLETQLPAPEVDALGRRRISVLARDLLHGSILYCSTLYFLSNALLLLLIPLLLFRPIRLFGKQRVLLIVGFSLLALINITVHHADFDVERHSSSPAVLLVPLVALLAPALSPRALIIFAIATCLEVLVGAYEFSIGQVALTEGQSALANQRLMAESGLIYGHRVFGLSSNSSILAEKIFISIILLMSMPHLFTRKLWISIVLAVGLVLTFNRTAIAGTLFFIALNIQWSKFNLARILIFATLSSILIAVAVSNMDLIILELTRSSSGEFSHSELARFYFWETAIDKIFEDPVAGNGSLTFRVNDLILESPQHVHNSVLMLFATHGVIIASLLVIYVVLGINSRNCRAIAAFFLFSMTQYFVFWNLSVPDCLLYWFLGHRSIRRPTAIAQGTSENVLVDNDMPQDAKS